MNKSEYALRVEALKAELELLCPSDDMGYTCARCGEGQFDFLEVGQVYAVCNDCGYETERLSPQDKLDFSL